MGEQTDSRPRPGRDRAPALALSVLVLAACGERPAAPPPRAAQATPAATDSPGGTDSPGATEAEPVRLVRAVRPLARHEKLYGADDPEREEWRCEVMQRRLEGPLSTLRALIARPDADRSAAAALVLDDFACAPLRPAGLATLRDDGRLVVRRWDPPPDAPAPPAFAGPEGLSAALRALFAVLPARAGAADEPEAGVDTDAIELQVFRLEQRDGLVASRLRFAARRRSSDASAQQTATWRCLWSDAGGGAPPRLAEIGLEAYEEVVLAAPRPLFSDCTAAALGGDPTWATLVLPGLDHWLPRVSQVVGMINVGYHGIALGDVDGDGLEDLYVCDAGGLPNRLYRQNPDGTVTDIAAEARVDWLDHTASALLVDLDGDGDQDLVAALRGLLLFAQNDGAARFSVRVRLRMGLGATSLCAADYDLDGDLDVYCCVYVGHVESEGVAFPYHDANNGAANVLLRNAGGFRFVDVTQESGLDVNNQRFSFAAAWEDYDDDGDPDLYVANDFGRNCLYRNDGPSPHGAGWLFTDVAASAGVEDVASGMSVTWGDYDRDGLMDVYIGNMYSSAGLRIGAQERFAAGMSAEAAASVRRMALGNTLYRNRGDGTFQEVSDAARARMGRWAWASQLADLDNDGWQDIVVTNGNYTMEDPDDLASFFWRNVVWRSPCADPRPEQVDEYLDWLLANTYMVRRGRSFNGNERANLLLSSAGDTFAEASGVSGLDFLDDGRALALVDWDGDGDLDMWFYNRTGPRLRLMSNETPRAPDGGDFVALLLRGTTCNRDAIGARVELEQEGGGGRSVQSVCAGDGFLTQSSRWLHFGLGRGEAASIRTVTVRWPGGASETFEGVRPGRRYELVQGTGRAVAWTRPGGPVALTPSEQPPFRSGRAAAVLLPARFPSPILRYAELGGGAPRAIDTNAGPLLVVLWSSGSQPCQAEIEGLARRAGELRAAGLDVLALGVDELMVGNDSGRGRAGDGRALLARVGFPFAAGRATAELVDKVAIMEDFLFDMIPESVLPTSLLLDGRGALAAIYRGRVDLDLLLAHARTLDEPLERRYQRALPFPGSWKILAPDVSDREAANWFVERYPEDARRYYELALARQDATPADRTPEGRLASDRARTATHVKLAQLLKSQGLADEALAHWRAALEIDAGHAQANRELGLQLFQRGERAGAIEHLSRSLEAEPASSEALLALGNAHLLEGRPRVALEPLRQALQLTPENAEGHNNLGNAHVLLGELSEAVASYRRAVAIRPDAARMQYSLGAALAMTGAAAESRGPYARALELDPDLAVMHLRRGIDYGAQNKLSEALAHFTLVIEARPELAEAWYQRAVARARGGDLVLAAEDLTQAERLAAGDSELRARIADLRARL